MRKMWVAAATTCFFGAIGCAQPKAMRQVCPPPPLTSFLEQQRSRLHYDLTFYPSPVADTVIFEAAAGPILWLGARWDNYDDGALFVIRCGGDVIDAARVGGVIRMAPQAIPDTGIMAVLTEINPGGGTGTEYREIDLFGLVDGHLTRLFGATTHSVEFGIPSEGGTLTARSVAISPGGDSIVVRGTTRSMREVGDTGIGLGPERPLLVERVCWSRKERKYGHCGGG